MIAACPKCSARYRIDREKLQAGAVRLRCTKCEAVFRVRAPDDPEPVEAAPQAATPAVAPAPQPAAQPEAAPAFQSEAPVAGTSAPVEPAPPSAPGALPDDAPVVLVAIPDADLGKVTAQALEARGLRAVVVLDGVQAMLETQRRLPVVVLVAADLPKMYGFQVCEVIKRNPSLNGIHVVLAGAIHDPDRYRRPPNELYGADAYIETPDLPGGLLPILDRLGIASSPPVPAAAAPEPPQPVPRTPIAPEPQPVPVTPVAPEAQPVTVTPFSPEPQPVPVAPVAPETTPQPAPAAETPPPQPVTPEPTPPAATPEPTPPVAMPEPAPPVAMPEPAPQAEAPAPAPGAEPSPLGGGAPGLEQERAKAERLARIIVSDIILYNEEKFAQAVQAGNVGQAMNADLTEGRSLFEERIDERVRAEHDYLVEELLRVARLRGME